MTGQLFCFPNKIRWSALSCKLFPYTFICAELRDSARYWAVCRRCFVLAADSLKLRSRSWTKGPAVVQWAGSEACYRFATLTCLVEDQRRNIDG